jgi:hypothetical protein
MHKSILLARELAAMMSPHKTANRNEDKPYRVDIIDSKHTQASGLYKLDTCRRHIFARKRFNQYLPDSRQTSPT